MQELVVISGKGGTGKTSTVAAFATLAKQAVLADCDVDAADLHLILSPTIQYREDFRGGKRASINPELCLGCGKCQQFCRFDAIYATDNGTYQVNPLACEGCGVCQLVCPGEAVDFDLAANGEWYLSQTRLENPMVHAKLGIAEENSGKLVTLVRQKAKTIATEQNYPLIVTDGSPGIGCPVMASLTGADFALVVTEPTPSGLHDLQRLVQLLQRFQMPGMVYVNKFDLNLELTEKIETYARAQGLSVVGRMPYTPAVTAAQTEGLSVVEFDSGEAAASMRNIWQQVNREMQKQSQTQKVYQTC
ncbi:ATP-binding protein [Geitlerinema sp. PCC 9228]|jgi:MinD superfamily P-loop ATPase|uniref:ATP-binding protein n=1 Tax=Geitlerinema sp. PCC 9228 TaxID=111611 RepID=UPI0008F9D435|nr:ATP-binding protein [Geitlerinema sp. PCC 9228]